MFAVLSGLGAAPVHRLQQTWKLLPSKVTNQFKELESLMDPSRNMSKYRCLKQENEMPPLVPFVPVIKKDLTFLHLGNDTKVEELINFEKMRMIQFSVEQMENSRIITASESTLNWRRVNTRFRFIYI